MAAYIIVDVDVRDAARFETYQQGVPSTIAQYGGRTWYGAASTRRCRRERTLR